MSVDKGNKAGVSPLIHAWKEGQVECAMLIKDLANTEGATKEEEHETPKQPSCKSSSSKEQTHEEVTEKGTTCTTEKETEKDLSHNPTIKTLSTQSHKSKSCSSIGSNWEKYPTRSRISPSETLSFLNHNLSMTSLCTTKPSSHHSKAFITRPKSAVSSRVSTTLSQRPHSAASSLRPPPNVARTKAKKALIVPQMITKNELCKIPIHDAVNHTRNQLAYLYQIAEYDDHFLKDNDGDLLSYLRQQQQNQQEHDNRSVDSDNGASDWRGLIRNLYSAYDFQFTPSFRCSAKAPPERPMSAMSETESMADHNSVCTMTTTTRRMRKISSALRNRRNMKKHASNTSINTLYEKMRGVPTITTELTDNVSEVSGVTASEVSCKGRSSKWGK
jgi:hypothetical protein